VIEAINRQIVERLKNDYHMTEQGNYLRGRCPECSKKTFWTWLAKPGLLQCDRLNNCGYEVTSKELFPEFFEKLNKTYAATVEDPKKTANAYISIIRGFPLERVSPWYEQGSYWNPNGDKGTATVRFWLNAEKTVYWERFVEPVTITDKDGSQDVRQHSFSGAFKGLYWQPPGQTIESKDKIHICEGIFKAMALALKGYKAISIMSSGSFPENLLTEHDYKDVKWILALDNDNAGREATKKHIKTIRASKQRVSCVLSSDSTQKLDWDDLYKLDKLEPEHFKLYNYFGQLETAISPQEKAGLIFMHKNERHYFCFDFSNRLYAVKVDSKEFGKAKREEAERLGIDLDICRDDELAKCKVNAFNISADIAPISTFGMVFLYFQQPQSGDTGQNFFKLHFANHSPSISHPFPGCVLSTASDFKKAVRKVSPSAIFTGSTLDLDYLSEEWQKKAPHVVQTVDYLGYDRVNKAYIYEDFAVEGGVIHKVNDQAFFKLKKSTIKTTHSLPPSIAHQLTLTKPVDWLNDYRTAYGTKGLVLLSWWFGTLFVQQIRAKHRSYPFFELFGEAGSGKSDMVDFLFKLLGMHNMGFNPSRGFTSAAGLTRKTSELANMPIVFNETENDNHAKEKHVEQFDWAKFLDFFEGRNGVAKGVATNDNKTRQPEFKAALMAVQNPQITGSEAIVTRFVTLNFDRSHHQPNGDGRRASDKLKNLPIKDVSGFLLSTVAKADSILKRYEERFEKYREQLAKTSEIKMQRITHCHAQIMALADCLPLILQITETDIANIHAMLKSQAITKQQALNEDHPVVQQFWANFEYLDTLHIENSLDGYLDKNRMNHSNKPDYEIAVNLEDFLSHCYEKHLPMLSTSDLRKYLPTSRSRKFIESKPVLSRLEKKTLRCWIFNY
jgi:hypothetical protein